MKLSSTAKEGLKKGAFMKDIRGYSQELIRQVKTGEDSFRRDNLTNTGCPVYGERILAARGENTEVLVCQDREYGHRGVTSRTSDTRCPICHKKTEFKGKGGAQIFVCRYGHKEKLRAFQERRKKEGVGMSKRDVARYLNQQKREAGEPVNNAFVKALAGTNLKDKSRWRNAGKMIVKPHKRFLTRKLANASLYMRSECSAFCGQQGMGVFNCILQRAKLVLTYLVEEGIKISPTMAGTHHIG